MKAELKDFPVLRETNGQKITSYENGENLKKSGMGSGATTRFVAGDTIEIPENIVSQETTIRGSDRPANLLAVYRNGRGAWVYPSSFRRMDANGIPCGEVCKANVDAGYATDHDMVTAMLGKKLVVSEVKEITAVKWVDGVQDGTRKQTVGFLSFGK